MLLQRTRAAQAEAVFLDLRAKFPRATDLVAAGPGVTREITSRTGLHWKGPLLYDAAERVSQSGGAPPEDLEQLLALPGIGPYAAAAWLSLHRGRRAVIIDSNVARWLARLEGRPYDPETRRKRWVADLADSLTPIGPFRDYNYAVLDFTMRICVPGRPRCDECPIRSDCHFGSSSQWLAPL